MPSSSAARSSWPALLVVGASLIALLAVVAVARPERPFARGGEEIRVAEAELAAKADRRVDRLARRFAALEAAKKEGRAGQNGPIVSAAAPGWAGELPMDPVHDDWEPSIAADPNGPYVYALVTRYAPKPCQGNCPSPWIAIERSSDNGATWTAGAPLCACKGSGQFDPIIEVVPSTGAVYALYMNGFNVVFTKSTNRGASWSTPVKTYGSVSWNDKPVLAMSDDGRHVYVSWNGPTSGDPWVAQSHDFGATWAQTKLVNSARYFFAFDADVAADGTVYFSESSLDYGSGGGGLRPPIEQRVLISRTAGATWENVLVASVEIGPECVATGCKPDFYLGHSAVSADANGNLVYLYDGATVNLGPQSVYAKRSTDQGRTWSAPVALSTAGQNAAAPMVESRLSGDVRAAWYETSGGDPDAWNVWYRSSTNGGSTWSAAVRISDATSGAAYKSAAGFKELYGDYGEIAITNTGRTIAMWGEGDSFDGPGGAWFNRQP